MSKLRAPRIVEEVAWRIAEGEAARSNEGARVEQGVGPKRVWGNLREARVGVPAKSAKEPLRVTVLANSRVVAKKRR